MEMKAGMQERKLPVGGLEEALAVDFGGSAVASAAREVPGAAGGRFAPPMTTLAGARDRLPGHNVLALIEETGQLSWAWNIGLGRAREIRVLTACIDHFARTGRELRWEWRRVVQEVFRGCDKPFLTGTHARYVLNCSPRLITKLVEAEALKTLPGTAWGTGSCGSPLISCESFLEFLRGRSMAPFETIYEQTHTS